MFLVFLYLIAQSHSYTFSYSEIISLNTISFIQMTSMIVPQQKYSYNPGNRDDEICLIGKIQGTLALSLWSNSTPFRITIFENTESPDYPCVINQIMIMGDSNECFKYLQNETIYYDCSQTSYYLPNMTINQQWIIQNCSLQNLQPLTIQLYDMNIQDLDYSNYVIILENLSSQNVLQFQSTYTQTLTPENYFESTMIGICIGLVILLILVVGTLCVINYKYQKLREENNINILIRGNPSTEILQTRKKNKTG